MTEEIYGTLCYLRLRFKEAGMQDECDQLNHIIDLLVAAFPHIAPPDAS